MSQNINALPLGAIVKDVDSKTFLVISHNHYGVGKTLLWSLDDKIVHEYSNNPVVSYGQSTLDTFVNHTLFNELSENLKANVLETQIPCKSDQTGASWLKRKTFVLSVNELGITTGSYEGTHINFLKATNVPFGILHWTRTRLDGTRMYGVWANSYQLNNDQYYTRWGVRYAFNVREDTKVTDTIHSDGTYHLVWNDPPTKPIIDTLSKEQGDPSVTSLTETITFKTTDPEGDPIESINIVIADALTNSEVLNQTLNQSELSYTIPESTLQPNKTYSVKVRAKDNQQNWSEFSDSCYMISKLFTITLNKNVTLNDGDKIELIELSAITNAQEMTLKSIEKETDKYKFELDGFNDSTTVDLEIKGKASTLEDILYTVS